MRSDKPIIRIKSSEMKDDVENTDKTQPRQEEQVRQFNEHGDIYRQIFQHSPFAILVHDTDMKIINANKKAVQLFGYSKEELVNKSLTELHTETELEHSERVLDELKTSEKDKMQVETSFTRKDGSVFYAEATPFKYKVGNKLLIHVYIQDISHRKASEIKLLNAMEKAEESDRLKSAFLANISHEIRTPMNGIIGFLNLLKNPNLTGKDQKTYIDIIEKSGQRLLDIISDVISISRIESGTVDIHMEEADINEQIEYVYTFFMPEVQSKGLEFHTVKPLKSIDAIIRTDHEKLLAVLMNLVKNAVKHTEKGSIEFGYSLKEQYLEFFVKDTGSGIPADRQEAIFDRFVQADIHDREAKQGTGLGLSISKAYVEMLEGEIWLESKPGDGSSFYFTLPYKSDLTNRNNNDHTDDEKTEEEPAISDLKIIIAEDDDISFFLLKTILEENSSEVHHARTGAEAIEMSRNHPDIDLILMDIKMPGTNGYEAVRQIRNFNRDVVIVAQTAFGLEGDREKALMAGCNEYLTKPVQQSELNKVLKQFFLEV